MTLRGKSPCFISHVIGTYHDAHWLTENDLLDSFRLTVGKSVECLLGSKLK